MLRSLVIEPVLVLPRKDLTGHGSGLGDQWRVVESTIAWLH